MPGGLFVLLSAKEARIHVVRSPDFAHILPEPSVQGILDAFLKGLRSDNRDKGLELGVQEIEIVLTKAAAEGLASQEEEEAGHSDSGMIVRDQIHLTLAGAQTILAGVAEEGEGDGAEGQHRRCG